MKKQEINRRQLIEFLKESNAIEGEVSLQALNDSLAAFDYAYKNRRKVWTVSTILNVHKLLARTLRPDIAGQIRNCSVWIGGEKKKFVSKVIIAEDLRKWIQEWWEVKTEEEIKKAHVEFEEIHCFLDFNGRSGRILYQIMRINADFPIHIIYEKEKYDYYEWFRK